jgi:putative redox protein
MESPIKSAALKKEVDMECTVRWQGSDAGMSFVAESGSGHALVMDGSPDAGGRNLGPRPMELVLAGTGGCSAFDVVLILKRGRHAVSGCEVKLTADRAEADPKVFTHVHFHYKVRGRQLKPEAVARAIELSKEKYCSASIMIAKTAEITHDFVIIEDS